MGLETTPAWELEPGRDRRPLGDEPMAAPRPVASHVLWDEAASGSGGGSWPAGGTLLFLWPRLQGDLRRPAWASRASELEDEYAPWWNLEDRRLAAGLLLPFYAGLVAFLSERGGPSRFEFADRFQPVRACLRRMVPARRARPPAVGLARAQAVARLAGLVEGAVRSDQVACTVTFGEPGAAILHVRRDERCLWLWLAAGLRPGFDRYRDGEGGLRFVRRVMDWTGTGNGIAAPRPPSGPGR